MDTLAKMLQRMIDLAVWDHAGRMYCPVFDYDDSVSHYARAPDAMDINNSNYYFWR